MKQSNKAITNKTEDVFRDKAYGDQNGTPKKGTEPRYS